jgi:hypothetical protein
MSWWDALYLRSFRSSLSTHPRSAMQRVLYESIDANISHKRQIEDKEIASPRFYPEDCDRDMIWVWRYQPLHFALHGVFHNFL